MPEKLKKGCTRVAFGDVVRLCRERSANPSEDGFERYVGLEHLEPGTLKIRRWGNTTDGTTFTNVFRAGQVLFGKRRAYQRKVAVADFDGVCSGDIYVLESADPKHLFPELLPFICQTDRFFEHAVGTSAGSLSPRTNWKSLADYEFALPPLDEQRRIAEVLVHANRVHRAYSAVTIVGGQLVRTATESLCWSASWPRSPVRTIADTCSGGFRDGDWIESKDQSPSGIRLLQLADIGEGEFLNKSRRYISEETFDRLNCTEVHAGDLLIARMADPIGRTCAVPQLEGRCIAAVDCCIVSVNVAEHDARYWVYVLNSPSWTRLVKAAAAGSTRSRISRTNLEAIRVPVPHLEQQRQIADYLSSIASSVHGAGVRLTALRDISKGVLFNTMGNQSQ